MNPPGVPRKFDPIVDYGPEGSLVFYSIRPITDMTPNPCTSVWWKDAQSPQGFGPFSSLQYAFNHYRNTIKQMKAEEAKPLAQVVQVDFRNKKRL